MKQETNNEIDLLLRRLSRRQGATTPDGDLRDHLDADELSSYAENALPAAARARYTEHLAECSRCRELVVQLSSAAGVVLAEEPSRVSAPSGLRKFLASLFSPMVLRYAVPAMGLIVVAVIGFTVFREGPGSWSPKLEATDRRVETPAVAQETKPQAGVEKFDDTQAKSGSLSPTPEPRQRNEAEPPAPRATPAANTPSDAIKEAPPVRTDSEAVATGVAPAAAAPKPAESTDEAAQRQPEGQKREAKAPAAATPQADKERDFQVTAGAAGAGTVRRPATRGALMAETEGAGARQKLNEKAQKDDAEIRSVAGRRFRRQRGIWVDTAYADEATTNLTRGSEQYRGLIGDEPSIKTIAEQLDGQIIVVWKGRAYHIR